MADFESDLGYTFKDAALLRTALTHRSWEAEHFTELASNERLEFLGDAVLGLVVAGELYAAGDMSEGAMAKVRAAVVNEAALARMARRLGLGDHIELGRGEAASGGHDKPSILADALEAVIGAVYLDGGMEAAHSLVSALWADLIAERAAMPGERDYKTRLQEVLASTGRVPTYEVTGTGPDHDRSFAARVSVGDDLLGEGKGSSKKRAQQEAARRALASLGEADA